MPTLKYCEDVSRDRRAKDTLGLRDINRTVFLVAQMIADGCVLIFGSIVSYFWVMYLHFPVPLRSFHLYLPAAVMTTAAVLHRSAHSGAYSIFNVNNRVQVLAATVKHFAGGLLLLTTCFFALKIGSAFSRLWLLTWCVVSGTALCGVRLMGASAIHEFVRRGSLKKRLAIVGGTGFSRHLSREIACQCPDTNLIGFFSEQDSPLTTAGNGAAGVWELQTLDELLHAGCVDEVVIALPPTAMDEIIRLLRRFHPFAVTVSIPAPAGYEQFPTLETYRYGNVAICRVMKKPLDELAVVIKWLEDKVIAAICLAASLPLMVIVAVAIKLDSTGPVLFKQPRLGTRNVQFRMFKFRTMSADRADPLGHELTRAGDPRITRVGRFLRRTSLDELPQLFNVLRGDMSLVGPRPHALAAKAGGVAYALAVDNYPIRHRMKPGMTGWAQVNGYRGETTTIEQIRRRVEHDLYYIQNWSLYFDFVILARTIWTVFSRTNAV